MSPPLFSEYRSMILSSAGLVRRRSQILVHWSDRLPSIADAGIAAITPANRYDTVATFDQKLIRQLASLGVASYWPVF